MAKKSKAVPKGKKKPCGKPVDVSRVAGGWGNGAGGGIKAGK